MLILAPASRDDLFDRESFLRRDDEFIVAGIDRLITENH